ncbi:acyltransferase [Fulvivirgaceae bacterium BMA10]|uniref:Acyltransferase n=1 Tax=Splendidivirga corallicola TaxID=3051826 RepID=A0ABT8L1E9_9BACT|nr:acyltransferase [Fulvivirgaceae bacterium BMA10]
MKDRLVYFLSNPLRLIRAVILKIPYFRFISENAENQNPITLEVWFFQKILGYNRGAYWPVHRTSTVNVPSRIYAGIDTSPGLMPGCYIQGHGGIHIGDYTQIAPNVGIISANHDLHDSRKHIHDPVYVGKYCWIGFGAVILPGVKLGDFTIVGAGSVVTKSFEKGYCVIAGNPAKEIKQLDDRECHRFKNTNEYNGYIRARDFENFSKKLNLLKYE